MQDLNADDERRVKATARKVCCRIEPKQLRRDCEREACNALYNGLGELEGYSKEETWKLIEKNQEKGCYDPELPAILKRFEGVARDAVNKLLRSKTRKTETCAGDQEKAFADARVRKLSIREQAMLDAAFVALGNMTPEKQETFWKWMVHTKKLSIGHAETIASRCGLQFDEQRIMVPPRKDELSYDTYKSRLRCVKESFKALAKTFS